MVVRSKEYLEQLIQKRETFNATINTYNIDKIIAIDESGFNMHSGKIIKGLSPVGKTLYVPITAINSRNISLLMAITTTNILNTNISDNSFTSNTFSEFIKNTILMLPLDDKHTFLFDNCSIHKNKNMLQMIKDAGHDYIFTPPYSPNNNPIENTFSILKQQYNKIKKSNLSINVKDNIVSAIQHLEHFYINTFKSIFERAFSYSYANIQKELKDRLHMLE
jgi:transposase